MANQLRVHEIIQGRVTNMGRKGPRAGEVYGDDGLVGNDFRSDVDTFSRVSRCHSRSDFCETGRELTGDNRVQEGGIDRLDEFVNNRLDGFFGTKSGEERE